MVAWFVLVDVGVLVVARGVLVAAEAAVVICLMLVIVAAAFDVVCVVGVRVEIVDLVLEVDFEIFVGVCETVIFALNSVAAVDGNAVLCLVDPCLNWVDDVFVDMSKLDSDV